MPVSRSASILVYSLLCAALTACGGLGGEPEIVATAPPITRPAQEISFPASAPDLNEGASIFAANCTACHGLTGMGDGEQVLSGAVNSPGDFTAAGATANQTPLDWFSTITNGRIENLMPFWRDALTESQRWAVALYTYTLSYTPQQIAAGQALVDARPALKTALESLAADQASMALLSDPDLANIAGENAPDLSAEERQQAAFYARSLSIAGLDALSRPPQIAQSSTPERATITQTAERGPVTGRVINGTTGGGSVAGLTVTLRLFDNNLAEQMLTTLTDADGEYVFEDVPLSESLVYFASVGYRDRNFASPAARLVSGTPLDMPIVIYELTEDPAVISITGQVIQIRPAGNVLEVLEVVRFRNDSDRLYVTSQMLDDVRSASVIISLPVGAIISGFDNPQRYVYVEDTFTLIDTLPVLPGDEHIIRLSYLLPYSSSAVIEYAVNYPMRGPLRLLLSSAQMTATGEGISALGPEQIGSATYYTYGAELSLLPGDVINFTLRGGGVAAPTAVTSTKLLPVVIIMIGVALAVVGAFFAVQSRLAKIARQDGRQIDSLIRQIADLDAQHDAGQINHDVYQRQRADLKERLAALLDAQKGAGE